MKKFSISMFIILCFAICADARVILEPQWSEFCPVSYLTVQDSRFKNKKYWYERRMQFEKSIEKCQVYQGADLQECYDNIRISEENKNKIWNAKIEQERADLEKMNQRNDQMRQYDLIRDVVNIIAK